MSGARLLLLGSYPALHARHGGQVRLAQLAKAYASRGWIVRQASFYPAYSFYTDRPVGEGDVGLTPEKLRQWRGAPTSLAEDLASGELVADSPMLLEALEAYSGDADVVHLEQPWLLPVVRRLRERGRIGDFRLVYGSQNIELELKRSIFAQHGLQGQEAVLAGIEQLERDCAEAASVVAAVTESDAQVMRGWGAGRVVVASNGVEPWTSTQEARSAWLAGVGDDPFALYVASSHPPNVTGLQEAFGGSLAGLSPVQKLVVAGGVGEALEAGDWFRRRHVLNLRRSVIAGLLADEALSALRDLAHCYILPVTSGGGSNLKTAEALYSGRHVVATPLAMRGFESFAAAPGLQVVAAGPAFVRAVSRCLEAPLPGADEGAARMRESLTWAHTLAPLIEAVGGTA
jgi:hypothetical protein